MRDLKTVMYVEDEADIRDVIEFALEDEGFTLEACISGEQALAKVARLTPDLILLDVMMPGLDGPATLQKLRQLPHLVNTPVIFMTAKVQPTEVQHYKALGALGVIHKPFNAMTLANEIRALLG